MAAGGNRQSDYLRSVVGVKRFYRCGDFAESGPSSLDETEPLSSRLNPALPAVDAFDRADNLDAGSQAKVDQRPSDATGNVPAGRCGDCLDEVLHDVSVHTGRH